MLRAFGTAGILAFTLSMLTGCGGPVAAPGGSSPVAGGSTSNGGNTGGSHGDSHGAEGGHEEGGNHGSHEGDGDHEEQGSGGHDEGSHEEGGHEEDSGHHEQGSHEEEPGIHDAEHEESEHAEGSPNGEHEESEHAEGSPDGEHEESEHAEGSPDGEHEESHQEGSPRPEGGHEEGGHEEGGHEEGGHEEGGHEEGGQKRPGGKKKPAVSEVPEHLKGLERKVYTSFLSGRDREAFMYHHANMLLAEGDAAANLAEHWITALKQPKTGVRWGIGVVYQPDRTYRGAPPKIGEAIKRANSNSGDEGRNRPGNDGATTPEDLGSQLEYFTGEVGSKALMRLENRRTLRPYWGELLKEAPEGSGGKQFATRGRSSENEYDMEEAEVYDEHDEGETNKQQPKREKQRAYLGAAQMTPGVLMLGTASQGELRENAEKMHVDLLMVFEVEIGRNRSGVILNTTDIKVIDLASKKTAARQTLNNVRVFTERKQKKDGDVDPVEEAFDRLFRVIDPLYKAAPMPDLAPEHVLVRAKQVVTGKYANPLEPLAEMKYYHGRNLVDDAVFNRSCELLMGAEDGAAFVAAQDYDARYAVIKKYLPGGEKDGLPREDAAKADEGNAEDNKSGNAGEPGKEAEEKHSEDNFR